MKRFIDGSKPRTKLAIILVLIAASFVISVSICIALCYAATMVPLAPTFVTRYGLVTALTIAFAVIAFNILKLIAWVFQAFREYRVDQAMLELL